MGKSKDQPSALARAEPVLAGSQEEWGLSLAQGAADAGMRGDTKRKGGHAAGRQRPTCFSCGPSSGCVQRRRIPDLAARVAPASIRQGLSPGQRNLRAAGEAGREQAGLCRALAVG